MSGLTFQDDLHIIAKRGDNYINFQAARQDQTGTANVQFLAWLAADGNYIFMKRDKTDSTDITTKYFFATASTQAFQAAWNDRTNKSYVEYNTLFT